jgi:hypothetical protein
MPTTAGGDRPAAGALVRALAALAWGLLAAGGASAQPVANGTGIYTCVDDRGRRLTADRPIPECTNREQKLLNRDGSVRGVQPPTLTAEERAEKEARDRAADEARAAQADAQRRDRNLTARYPTEAAHSRGREAALDTVRLAIKATELRLRDLVAERKPLAAEAEFYVGKNLPAKLRAAMDANDAATDAQRSAVGNQTAELDRINKLYDAELARLRALWAGAPPGSLGPLPPAAAGPVAHPHTSTHTTPHPPPASAAGKPATKPVR